MTKAKNVTLDKDVIEEVERLAEEDGRKFSNMVNKLLREALDGRESQ